MVFICSVLVFHIYEIYSRFVFLQNALFGMDIPMYDNTRIVSEFDIFYGGITDPFLIDDNFVEVCSFKCLIFRI